VTGEEGKKAEGNAQQRKATAREEREQQKRTKAERAEKSRDKQERKNKGSWATLGTPSQDDRRPPSPLDPVPEPMFVGEPPAFACLHNH
jgi:hypothetical protein